MAVSATGKLAVCDNLAHRVLIWNTVPTTSGVAADLVLGQSDFTSTGYACTSVSLNAPTKVFWHGANLWVADTGNHRVLRYTAPISNGQAASLVVGQANFTSGSLGTSATQMNEPVSVLIFGGKLYVVDRANCRVLVYDTLPTSNGAAASFALGQASGASNLTSSVATTYGANLVYGMLAPNDLAVTSTYNLMVVDSGNNRVMVFSGIPTTGGASASTALFQPDVTTNPDIFPCSSTRTNYPTGIAVSSTGQIAITDKDYSRCLIYYDAPTSNDAPAHAVLGQPDFTTSTAWASNTASVMGGPTGVAWHGTSLIVCGSDMSRAMKFSPA